MSDVAGESGAAPDWTRLEAMIDAALGELNERERVAVLLRFFEKHSLAEVGARLALTETAARSCVDRALEKMRVALARRGVTSTGAALALALANQVSVAAPAGLAASIASSVAAGGSGATIAGAIFELMSTTKIVVAAAGVIALSLVGWSVREARRVAAVEGQLATTVQQRDRLQGRVSALEKEAAGLRAASEPAARQAAADDRATADLAGARSPPGRPAGPMGYALEHPEARSAFLQQAALTAKLRFERFFRTAGLTGEQQDRFLKIAMDDAEGRLEVLALRRSAGALDPDAPPMDAAAIETITATQKRLDDQNAAALRALLGERMPSLVDYMKTIGERNVADELASHLYYTDAPLAAGQAEQLTRILAENAYTGAAPSPRNTLGGVPLPREIYNGAMTQAMNQDQPWMWRSPITDAAVARAATVLAPTQVAVLKVLQAEQAARLQLLPPKKSKDAGGVTRR
jgi:hypothetical protein